MGREPYAHYRHLMADDSVASVHAFRENHQGLVTAEMIARGLLPYAVVSNWNYTLHDIDHSYRVCDNINMVLDMLPDASRPDPKGIEILYQAALLHDAGMAFLSRDKERGIGVSHAVGHIHQEHLGASLPERWVLHSGERRTGRCPLHGC